MYVYSDIFIPFNSLFVTLKIKLILATLKLKFKFRNLYYLDLVSHCNLVCENMQYAFWNSFKMYFDLTHIFLFVHFCVNYSHYAMD